MKISYTRQKETKNKNTFRVIEEFKSISDVIVANRLSDDLLEMKDK